MLAEKLNITETAEELYITQPALSEYVDPLIKRFQKEHSNINISIHSSQPYQIFRDLNESTIDLGMLIKFKSIQFKNSIFIR